MASGDGVERRCHPILAAYVGDYPEQCLVTCAYTGDCPVCDCPHDDLGSFPCEYDYRDLDAVYEALDLLGSPKFNEACESANLKPIQHPFWEKLPYVDIFLSITADILHQLYQGVVRHLLSWLTDVCGAAEIDARITSLSRVSGTEHKQMCRFLLGLVVDIPMPRDLSAAPLVRATRSILNFLYLAQYPVHTEETLQALDASLMEYHANKYIFMDLGIRDQFNIPKFHFLEHYARSIRLFGTTDNYNTESTERLHIDFAKDAYQRREKVIHHAKYIVWRSHQAVSAENIIAVAYERRWEPPDMACALHQKMTRHPTRKGVDLELLASPSHYGATFFVPALTRFIAQYNNPTFSIQQIEECAATIRFPYHSVPVFHKIKFWNEEVHGQETLDSIHAHPRIFDKDGDVVVPAPFDTALIQVRAARLEDLVGLTLQGTPPPRHLAYVEWFSKFTASPDANLKMYKVKQTLKDGARLASVVPLSLIQISVHFLPKWRRAVPAHWTSENVLDQCSTFYVNPFKNRHTYFNLY
ncbi:hypothetical protein BKA93DRAFT_888051 [Sparassis latifolia]